MAQATEATTLEWIKTIGSILLSGPSLGLMTIIIFRKSLLKLIEQFASGDVNKIKLGSFELERQLTKLTDQGQQAVSNLNRLNELMAESRLLELEITQNMFGQRLTKEQRDRMEKQIQEFSMLTRKDGGSS